MDILDMIEPKSSAKRSAKPSQKSIKTPVKVATPTKAPVGKKATGKTTGQGQSLLDFFIKREGKKQTTTGTPTKSI